MILVWGKFLPKETIWCPPPPQLPWLSLKTCNKFANVFFIFTCMKPTPKYFSSYDIKRHFFTQGNVNHFEIDIFSSFTSATIDFWLYNFVCVRLLRTSYCRWSELHSCGLNVQSEGGGSEGTRKLQNNQMVSIISDQPFLSCGLWHPEVSFMPMNDILSAAVPRVVFTLRSRGANVKTTRSSRKANCVM